VCSHHINGSCWFCVPLPPLRPREARMAKLTATTTK
jgi:hypothetical protein